MNAFIASEEHVTEQNSTMELLTESLLGPETFAQRMGRTGWTVEKYYTPLLCLAGILGNTLSVAVFCLDAKYRNQSASFYLSALAISDTGFLFSLLAIWLERVMDSGGIVTSSNFVCALDMYLGQVTCFLSVYLTVVFSIERYVAVQCPFSRPRICTRAKAKKSVACLTVLALLIFSYVWVIARVEKYPLTQGKMEEQENVTLSHKAPFPVTSLPPTYALMEDEIVFTLSNSSGFYGLPQRNESFEGNEEEWQSGWGRGSFERGQPNDHKKHQHDNESKLSDDFPTRTFSSEDFEDDSPSFKYFCSVPKYYHSVSEIANYVDTVITLIIPFFLITFFNVQIATSVWRLKTQRQSIVATPSRDSSYHGLRSTSVGNIEVGRVHESRVLYRPGQAHRNARYPMEKQNHIFIESLHDGDTCRTVKYQNENADEHQNHLRPCLRNRLTTTVLSNDKRVRGRRSTHYISPEVRVTKTLLLVSSVFLILNLPSHVIRCAQFVQTVTGTQEGKDLIQALLPWSIILFNTSFAVNLLLYVSGRNFRASLHNLLRRWVRRNLPNQQNKKIIKERLSPRENRPCYVGTKDSCVTSYLRINLENLEESQTHPENPLERRSSFTYSNHSLIIAEPKEEHV